MPLSAIPAKHVVIVTCMDSRVDPLGAFGLEHGDAHLLRNAGAVASVDADGVVTAIAPGTASLVVTHASLTQAVSVQSRQRRVTT